MKADPYSEEEMEALRTSIRSGDEPVCPRCRGGLQRRDIKPRGDVSYVRNRRWLVCGPCRRTAVVDLPERGEETP